MKAKLIGVRGEREESHVYDLVVVGGGISGLAAAHFYRKENPDARILILDNHDDFGGHAKRNEFSVDGKTLIGYGGSQTLEDPSYYNQPSKTLLEDLGVDVNKFDDAYDFEFYERHGLRAATYFDAANWGGRSTGRLGSWILAQVLASSRLE